jgi:hypothetical protein
LSVAAAASTLGAMAPLLAAAHSAADVRERAAALLREGSYQTTLPSAPAPPHGFELPLGPLELLLRILLWTAVAVAVVLAISWLARRLSRAPADAEVPDAPAAEPVAIPVESAEALAREGRFADAIHALLLDTLAALAGAARLAPSLTSREIAARVPLPDRAREALSDLVLAVELSRFGGAAAGEDDYRSCLGRFHAFLEAYRGAA